MLPGASERQLWLSQSSAILLAIYLSNCLYLSPFTRHLMHCQALFLFAGGWFCKPAYSHRPEGKEREKNTYFTDLSIIAGINVPSWILNVSDRPSYTAHAVLWEFWGFCTSICLFFNQGCSMHELKEFLFFSSLTLFSFLWVNGGLDMI